jgi:hypothetical protein
LRTCLGYLDGTEKGIAAPIVPYRNNSTNFVVFRKIAKKASGWTNLAKEGLKRPL